MILGGGLEEIGWRGFLQPALERKLPFPVATIIVCAVWTLWHLPLWLIDATNQANYDIIPYIIQLLVDTFILAAIYKSTKSTFACIFFHAWGNAIGAVYDWSMFATFPINPKLIVYDILMITISIILWYIFDKREKCNESQKIPS